MKYLYDADDIGKMIPQKYPFCLVDRVVEYKQGKKILCLKNVTQNEEFFTGHFPHHKIMPGVLICEALAQTCGLFGIIEMKQKSGEETKDVQEGTPELAFLASINIKFTSPVHPGDQLFLQAMPARAVAGLRAFDVEAMVDGQTVCKGIIKTTVRKGSESE